MTKKDDVVGRIDRAFTAAFRRHLGASTNEVGEDEISNMLHHLYRLWEFGGHGDVVPSRRSKAQNQSWVLLAVRNSDTHALVSALESADIVPDYVRERFDVLVWQDQSSFDGIDQIRAKRRKLWDQLFAGKAAAESLRSVFDDLASETARVTG